MRAVITVIGRDKIGILSEFSGVCAANGVNVLEVSQSVLQDLFAMTMLVDVTALTVDFTRFGDLLKEAGRELRMEVHLIREDLFEAMYQV